MKGVDMDMKTDIELYYRKAGDGYPLILLHGNNEDHSYFKNQIEYFSHYANVIAIDTRGHGRSPRGKAPFTISRFADDLHDFMTGHHIEKANILGFSDGGNIALVFAMRYPQKINKLILNGANLYYKGMRASVRLPVMISYRTAAFRAKKNTAAASKAEMLGLMVNDPDLSEKDLGKIHCPTLVIAGTRDMIKRKHTEAIHKGIKNSELVFIKGDHFIAKKKPGAFNRAVHDFLKG